MKGTNEISVLFPRKNNFAHLTNEMNEQQRKRKTKQYFQSKHVFPGISHLMQSKYAFVRLIEIWSMENRMQNIVLHFQWYECVHWIDYSFDFIRRKFVTFLLHTNSITVEFFENINCTVSRANLVIWKPK